MSSKVFTIEGEVVYENIGTGIWGIVDAQGAKWRPIDMPEQLKKVGKKVRVTAKKAEGMSIFMWGTDIELVQYGW